MNYHEIKLIARKLRNNQTPFEKQLWKRIRDRQLDGFKFLRQHFIIYDRNGNELNVFVPDFYCPKTRLAIEIDGGVHDNVQDHDKWRDEIITAMDIEVLRFNNDELIDMESVLQKIRRKLSTPAAHVNSTYSGPQPTPDPSLPVGRGGVNSCR